MIVHVFNLCYCSQLQYRHWWTTNNGELCYGAIWSLQIALESVCVIDNGETMLVEGLRVAPQERGKGVAGVLLRFCSELVKSKYPDVKVTRLTRDDQLRPKDFQKYRIITKQVPKTMLTKCSVHPPVHLPAPHLSGTGPRGERSDQGHPPGHFLQLAGEVIQRRPQASSYCRQWEHGTIIKLITDLLLRVIWCHGHRMTPVCLLRTDCE